MSSWKPHRFAVAVALAFVTAVAPRTHAAIVANLNIAFDQNGAPTPAGAITNITNAMNAAVGIFNAWSDYNHTLNVTYNTGIDTADGNINGSIRFGPGGQYHNANVAFHEILHTLGAGTYWNYPPNVDNNAKRWLGPQGIAMSQRYFPTRALVADLHVWWVDQEGTDMTRPGVHMMGAIRADMGLSNANVGVVTGDFTNDGVLNSADYLRLRANLLQSFPTFTPAQSYLRGDLTADRKVNHADFAAFRTAYLAVHGAAAFDAMVAGVPEPAALALGCHALVLVGLLRRR